MKRSDKIISNLFSLWFYRQPNQRQKKNTHTHTNFIQSHFLFLTKFEFKKTILVLFLLLKLTSSACSLMIMFRTWIRSAGKFLDEKVDACYLETIGGGCPDVNACMETCRPCYRGIGVVLPYCVAPGGGINYWRCRCDFRKGAPCPPPGPPTCPAPPPPPARESHHRKIGGQVLDRQNRPIFNHHDQNVTENVIYHQCWENN